MERIFTTVDAVKNAFDPRYNAEAPPSWMYTAVLAQMEAAEKNNKCILVFARWPDDGSLNSILNNSVVSLDIVLYDLN